LNIYTPVILIDSKARYLEQEVISTSEKKLQWWYAGSATANDQLRYLKDNLEIKLHRHPRILLYIWVGTCNLTRKNGDFIELKPRDNLAVHELTKTIYAFVSDFPTVKLSFLELPYYSIFHWNAYKKHPTPGEFKNDDFLLMDQIGQINSFIRETNILLRKYSPKFNCDLQNCRKDRFEHVEGDSRYTLKFYNFFLDGIHPCPALARLWLLRICELAQRDCSAQ